MANTIRTIDLLRSRIEGTRISYDPHSARFTFINSEDGIWLSNLDVYETWYTGDTNQLLNLYTEKQLIGFNKEPIYRRNDRSLFWAQSAMEDGFKRTHVPMARAMADVTVNLIGFPAIKCPAEQSRVDRLIRDTRLRQVMTEQQMPLTFVCGWGCYKPRWIQGEGVSLAFYKAKDVDFVCRNGRFLGADFRDYYVKGSETYCLVESRYVKSAVDGTPISTIEYHLYRTYEGDGEGQSGVEVPLNTIGELANLATIELVGYGKPLCAPCRFFYDPLHEEYGRSAYQGLIELFDDLDQNASIASMTTRKSLPIEYIPSTAMDRDRNGNVSLPSAFQRQYVQTKGALVADSKGDGDKIQVTQPKLNLDQYEVERLSIMDSILVGMFSPATFGIDVSRKDNATAQREKEKISILTRNNMIAEEADILRNALEGCMVLEDFESGKAIEKTPEISIEFNEFANPSLEEELGSLLPSLQAGAISPEKFVDLVWGDKLPPKARQIELDWIKSMISDPLQLTKEVSDTQSKLTIDQLEAQASAPTEPTGATEPATDGGAK